MILRFLSNCTDKLFARTSWDLFFFPVLHLRAPVASLTHHSFISIVRRHTPTLSPPQMLVDTAQEVCIPLLLWMTAIKSPQLRNSSIRYKQLTFPDTSLLSGAYQVFDSDLGTLPVWMAVPCFFLWANSSVHILEITM